MTSYSAEEVAKALEKPRRSGTGWIACCPAHDDHNPSLSVNDGLDGRVLLHCFTGCQFEEISAALKARGIELNGSSAPASGPEPPLSHPELGPYERHWDYFNRYGMRVLRVCRWNLPSGKKEIRPLLQTSEGWEWKQHAAPRPLFHLPELLASSSLPVLVVEGERTAVAAQRLLPQYIVTTWPGGASTAAKADWSPLAKRRCLLVPDADQPGYSAMIEVAQILDGLGCEVLTARPSGYPDGWDIADALTDEDQLAVKEWLDEYEFAIEATLRAIDWADLESKTPPQRAWAINHWLGMGHVTLIAGAGGTGKTSIVQAAGSCIALARPYLGEVGMARRVLMWATEDDETELWRRQLAIAQWLGVPLSDFAGKFYAHSYDGQQVELAASVDQRRIFPTEHYKTLCEQIGDYKAEVIILDNVARLFAGNENDRHQVTSFVALLAAAAKPMGASILLLGHPGKALGSEYSGSTAWEGAVRARWYLGYKLPSDAKDDDDGNSAPEDGARFLSKRKANYSPMDWRRITYREGVMVPDEPAAADAPRSIIYGKSIVARAIRKLAEMQEYGNTSTASPNYLPKLARRFKLLEDLTEREFATAVIAMRKDGELVIKVVGSYANRSPKEALALP